MAVHFLLRIGNSVETIIPLLYNTGMQKYTIAIIYLLISVYTGIAQCQSIAEDWKIVANDGSPDDFFSDSLDIDGGIIAVGSSSDRDNGIQSGSAYLFDAITGKQLFKLLPNDGSAYDFFADSIAINQGLVIVGAEEHDSANSNSGAAYVFDSATGLQISKLTPSDGAFSGRFGNAVDIDSGLIAIGARGDDDHGFFSGSVYLYNTQLGSEIYKLTASDGQSLDQFGSAVALNNGIVAIGAPGHDSNGDRAGAIYLFDVSTGQQLMKIVRPNKGPHESLGSELALGPDYVVSTVYQTIGTMKTGKICVFRIDTGEQLYEIYPEHNQGENFDVAIGLDDDNLVVGLRYDTPLGTMVGSARLYSLETGMLMNSLSPSDGEEGDWFGHSIAIDGHQVIVGSVLDDDNGSNSGSTYSFDIYCPADLNSDGFLDLRDVSFFLAAFISQNLFVDFNDDGILNFFDISAFLGAFSTGCP
ncbi:hypothetical protein COB72_06265 [bacterium]|nr:MAG: hypothetical protein COB72_06265 [bacterium]